MRFALTLLLLYWRSERNSNTSSFLHSHSSSWRSHRRSISSFPVLVPVYFLDRRWTSVTHRNISSPWVICSEFCRRIFQGVFIWGETIIFLLVVVSVSLLLLLRRLLSLLSISNSFVQRVCSISIKLPSGMTSSSFFASYSLNLILFSPPLRINLGVQRHWPGFSVLMWVINNETRFSFNINSLRRISLAWRRPWSTSPVWRSFRISFRRTFNCSMRSFHWLFQRRIFDGRRLESSLFRFPQFIHHLMSFDFLSEPPFLFFSSPLFFLFSSIISEGRARRFLDFLMFFLQFLLEDKAICLFHNNVFQISNWKKSQILLNSL